MMFNLILSETKMFQLLFMSFFVILTIRRLLFKRTIYILVYYSLITIAVFVLGALAAGSVLNSEHACLEKFQRLEKTNELRAANLDTYCQSYLIQFETSSAFKEYIQIYDSAADKAEVISVGLFFALLAEISSISVIFFAFARRVTVALINRLRH